MSALLHQLTVVSLPALATEEENSNQKQLRDDTNCRPKQQTQARSLIYSSLLPKAPRHHLGLLTLDLRGPNAPAEDKEKKSDPTPRHMKVWWWVAESGIHVNG